MSKAYNRVEWVQRLNIIGLNTHSSWMLKQRFKQPALYFVEDPIRNKIYHMLNKMENVDVGSVSDSLILLKLKFFC